jgi:hypothetical protein
MAGVVRIIIGVSLIIMGFLTLFFMAGMISLLLGIVFIVWGLDAKHCEESERQQPREMLRHVYDHPTHPPTCCLEASSW